MASYTTIEDWQAVESGYVVDVTIRQTEVEMYPSGWDYSLHLGEVGVETIQFPGMLTLYDCFKREVEAMTPVSWGWSE